MAIKQRARTRAKSVVAPYEPPRPGSPRRRLHTGRRRILLALATVTGLLLVRSFAPKLTGPKGHPSVVPIDLPSMTALPQFSAAYRSSMLWGTYRPGLYFGMRMRLPESLLAGLMWFDPERPNVLAGLRHEAQERDGLRRYGWQRHDGRTFGEQELLDGHLNITTSMVKHMCDGCGSGGDWSVRIKAERAADMPPPAAKGEDGMFGAAPDRVSLLFYLGDEQHEKPQLQPVPKAEGVLEGVPGRQLAHGRAPGAGSWSLHASGSTTTGKPAELKLHALPVHTRHFHNLTDLARTHLGNPRLALQRPLGVRAPEQPNLVFWQLTADLPLTLELTFLGGHSDVSVGGVPQPRDQSILAKAMRRARQLLGRPESAAAASTAGGDDADSAGQRLSALTGSRLSERLQERRVAFDARFSSTFGDLDAKDAPAGTNEVAKRSLSNMLGGLGYFAGRSIIGIPDDSAPGGWLHMEGTAAELFTGVPSRSFFPRGFLWDEGFHQLLVRRWDPQLSRDVVGHWLDLMTAAGWIPREQILGAEAAARVPPEYITQKITHANPPTLLLVIASMAKAAAAAMGRDSRTPEEAADVEFLNTALPRLEAWVAWFNATQAGPLPGSFRWRGRDAATEEQLNPLTLNSGLDDAPRASHPSRIERHLDLRCWLALAARQLATIAQETGQPASKVQPYRALAASLEDFDTLRTLHYDETRRQFLDYGNHSDGVSLQWGLELDAQGLPWRRSLRRETAAPPHPQLVPQFGYIALFPLMLRLLPADSPELGHQLAQLTDPELLWTPFGLRSLARSASLYNKHNTEHSGPYWRSPIWFNCNYLTLQALHHYAHAPGPHAARAAEVYSQLRRRVLANIVAQYQRTGYLWENYDDGTGAGRGSHPFTGWTALFVLVAGETYD